MVVRPDRPHDTFFKETFGNPANAAAELRHLLRPTLGELLDWSTLRVESGTFLARDDDHRFSDLLFSVRRADTGAKVLVFVLFEHQSTNHRLMPLRLLHYMVRIWVDVVAKRKGAADLALPPIVPVVLSHAQDGWKAPQRFHGLFAPGADGVFGRFVPSFEYLVDDLAKASNRELSSRGLAPEPTLSLWALRDGRSPNAVFEHLPHWAPMFAALAQLPGGDEAIARIIGYLGEAAGTRSADVETMSNTIAEHAPGAKEAVMNSVERLREQGRVEGQRLSLLKLVRRKFGEPSQRQLAVVDAARGEMLDDLLERTLDASALEEVLGPAE